MKNWNEMTQKERDERVRTEERSQYSRITVKDFVQIGGTWIVQSWGWQGLKAKHVRAFRTFEAAMEYAEKRHAKYNVGNMGVGIEIRVI